MKFRWVTRTASAAALVCVAIVAALASTARADEVAYRVTAVTGTAALGETLTVEVENLAKWADKNHPLTKAMLYLNGHALVGIGPQVDLTSNRLRFTLKRTDDSKPAWAAILGRPDAFTRHMPVTVGFDDGSVLPSAVALDFTLIRQDYTFWFCLFASVFAIVLFGRLVVASNILRDSGPPPGNGKRKPFSLGRTQMAFWFFVVLVSYLLIWLVTGDRDSVPNAVLGLIGISSSTALGAVMVDTSKRAAATSERQALTTEQDALTTRLGQLQPVIASGAGTQDAKREYAEKSARLTQVQADIATHDVALGAGTSDGFLNDILSDADGISLHRFQVAVWTVVLGFIFATAVYAGLAMPEFNTTLLTLMGISNGTYLGFKFPEKQA